VDLNELESELRTILVPYEDVLESSEIYAMEVLRRPGAKAHDWFAGVRQRSGMEGVSPELRKRKAGASLFTLREGDEQFIDELEALLQQGVDAYVGQPSGYE
jgi:hypothetical protein